MNNQKERGPLLDMLHRYRAVLTAAWVARRELVGPNLLADEAAFLPAALSLQHTPVHPAPRRAAWAILALFTLAVVWCLVGEVDVVAVAPGRIVVSGQTKVIQAFETSVVKAIHVKDGDKVQEGQVLVELDPTAVAADLASVSEQLAAARAELLKAQTLLRAVRSGETPEDADSQDGSSSTLSQWKEFRAKISQQQAEIVRREAEIATAREALGKVQALLPLAKQREADFKDLERQGFVSGHSVQDRARDRTELEREMTTQQARVVEAAAAAAEARRAAGALRLGIERELTDRIDSGRLKVAQLEQELRKTQQRQKMTRLTSPVAGIVQQLSIHTPGGVATATQPLMIVVPKVHALNAEVLLENKDAGFVSEGQAAEVKVDAYPFTRYGTVPAKVSRKAKDAVIDERLGARFPVSLTLVDYIHEGQAQNGMNISAGMTVVAEIKTGRRLVWEYFVDPIRKTSSGALSER